jgi:hypothetical protein
LRTDSRSRVSVSPAPGRTALPGMGRVRDLALSTSPAGFTIGYVFASCWCRSSSRSLMHHEASGGKRILPARST